MIARPIARLVARFAALAAALAVAALATGCSMTVHIPEEAAFSPRPVVQGMTITWVVADDPTAECKRLLPSAYGFAPLIPACAGWDLERKTCVIVTPRVATHQIVGHEIRHCFEGRFHN